LSVGNIDAAQARSLLMQAGVPAAAIEQIIGGAAQGAGQVAGAPPTPPPPVPPPTPGGGGISDILAQEGQSGGIADTRGSSIGESALNSPSLGIDPMVGRPSTLQERLMQLNEDRQGRRDQFSNFAEASLPVNSSGLSRSAFDRRFQPLDTLFGLQKGFGQLPSDLPFADFLRSSSTPDRISPGSDSLSKLMALI